MTQIFPNHPIIDQANAMIWNGAEAMVVLPRVRTHYGSQNVNVAAMHTAEKKVWAQRS